MLKRHGLFVAFMLINLVASGCGSGEPAVWVTGKLVKGGSKYDAPSDQSLHIMFIATEVVGADGKPLPSDATFPAQLERDSGIFKVPGNDGYGIPPGKYRIAITQTLTSEAAAKQKGRKRINREADLLGDKFSETSSPIIREIKDATELVIDLDHPAG